MHDTKVLLDASQNTKLERVFDRYTVKKVERCVPRRESRQADWVEVWVLVIAAFIGVGGTVAAISVCCLYNHYRRRLKRYQQHLRLLESPPSVTQVLPPGSIVMLPPGPPPPGPPHPNGAMPPASLLSSEPPRAYEWQERGLPLDTVSYRSAQR
ncbi:putative Cadherin-23-like 2 [Homarus americanus]|uniref:Putative Cadherin-23-like 2 n=2 Tax=Homarus americanus TaxID=6706 RepID=A0A8J5N0K0_HOMAM|nr:putative Cadherin-23-like 2 [Homarus americanus]